MQKVLITGANGFLGYYLVQEFLHHGFKVIATGKGQCRLDISHPSFIYESMDFTNDESVRQVFDKHQPAVIVHNGAMSKPDDCELDRHNAFLTNVTGTIYLLDHAGRYKSFFVFVSTDFVFDGEKGMYTEEDERKAVNFYGETKLLAEDEVKKYEYGWSIVRTVLVFGKPQAGRQNILTNTANALKKGENLRIFNDQSRTPTFVEDLAKGMVTIVEQKAEGIYHLSGEDVMTPYEMAIAVADYLELDASLIEKVSKDDFKQPAVRPPKTGFDISKAKKKLGFRPVSFLEGLKKTFE
jgi:dTDP-4-dehydrorhamnose reductase